MFKTHYNHKQGKAKITNKKAAIAFLFHHATHLQREKSEPQYARNCFYQALRCVYWFYLITLYNNIFLLKFNYTPLLDVFSLRLLFVVFFFCLLMNVNGDVYISAPYNLANNLCCSYETAHFMQMILKPLCHKHDQRWMIERGGSWIIVKQFLENLFKKLNKFLRAIWIWHHHEERTFFEK